MPTLVWLHSSIIKLSPSSPHAANDQCQVSGFEWTDQIPISSSDFSLYFSFSAFWSWSSPQWHTRVEPIHLAADKFTISNGVLKLVQGPCWVVTSQLVKLSRARDTNLSYSRLLPESTPVKLSRHSCSEVTSEVLYGLRWPHVTQAIIHCFVLFLWENVMVIMVSTSPGCAFIFFSVTLVREEQKPNETNTPTLGGFRVLPNNNNRCCHAWSCGKNKEKYSISV